MLRVTCVIFDWFCVKYDIISESGAGVSLASDSALETIPLTVAPEVSGKESSTNESSPSQTAAFCNSQNGNVFCTNTMLSRAKSKTWIAENLLAISVPESESSSQVNVIASSMETLPSSATEALIGAIRSENQSPCDEKPIEVK